jgi:octaprenyl-diphosphate synthase
MNSHNALRDSIERARHYGATAKDSLGVFSESPVKQSMIDLVGFCIDRAY